LFPNSVDSSGITSSYHVAEVPEDATGGKKAPTGCQVDVKWAMRESCDQRGEG